MFSVYTAGSVGIRPYIEMKLLIIKEITHEFTQAIIIDAINFAKCGCSYIDLSLK